MSWDWLIPAFVCGGIGWLIGQVSGHAETQEKARKRLNKIAEQLGDDRALSLRIQARYLAIMSAAVQERAPDTWYDTALKDLWREAHEAALEYPENYAPE